MRPSNAPLRQRRELGRPSSDLVPGLTVTWSDLDENGGVLEVHEKRAHVTLSLFVVVPFAGASLSSWWTNDEGAWLGPAVVGSA